jgi:hypothetical protein
MLFVLVGSSWSTQPFAQQRITCPDNTQRITIDLKKIKRKLMTIYVQSQRFVPKGSQGDSVKTAKSLVLNPDLFGRKPRGSVASDHRFLSIGSLEMVVAQAVLFRFEVDAKYLR